MQARTKRSALSTSVGASFRLSKLDNNAEKRMLEKAIEDQGETARPDTALAGTGGWRRYGNRITDVRWKVRKRRTSSMTSIEARRPGEVERLRNCFLAIRLPLAQINMNEKKRKTCMLDMESRFRLLSTGISWHGLGFRNSVSLKYEYTITPLLSAPGFPWR